MGPQLKRVTPLPPPALALAQLIASRGSVHSCAMALSKLSPDEQSILFTQLCNVLEPGVAVALSSVSNELWAATQALRPRLMADHRAATALCLKVGLRSCKEMRGAESVHSNYRGLTAADLALLGTLGSVLPVLETLYIAEPGAGSDGVQRLAVGLGAGALSAVTEFGLTECNVGDAGASALAAALGRGAFTRLQSLNLYAGAIGDVGLVALAPALRRSALEKLVLEGNPLSDEGLAALVAPPPPAGASPQPTAGLTKLRWLYLQETRITSAGCTALAAALDSGALPALETLVLSEIPASAAAKAAVYEARANLKDGECRCWSGLSHREPTCSHC